MRYLYEGHLGILFTAPYELDYDERHCGVCGDDDWLIGSFETIEEFWDLIEPKCDVGGWSLQYVFPLIVWEFNLPDNLEMDGDDCVLSDSEIIGRIEQLIGRKIKYESKAEY